MIHVKKTLEDMPETGADATGCVSRQGTLRGVWRNRLGALSGQCGLLATRFSLVVLTVFLAAACGPSTQRLELEWDVQFLEDPELVSCEEAGTDVVSVQATNIETGEVFEYVFDCAAYGGRTGRLPVGRYEIVYRLESGGEVPQVVSELAEIIDLGPGAVAFTGVTFLPQSFVLPWTLLDPAGNLLSCRGVGVDTVVLEATDLSGPGDDFLVWAFEFPCDDLNFIGQTQAVQVSRYAYSVVLLDAAGNEIVRSPEYLYDTPVDARALLEEEPFFFE